MTVVGVVVLAAARALRPTTLAPLLFPFLFLSRHGTTLRPPTVVDA